MRNFDLKSAFTMAEAIIVMTILGIIATIMITNLKPAEFRDKGLEVLANKLLREIDDATQQIIVNNTMDSKLNAIYIPGSSSTYTLYDNNQTYMNHTLNYYKKYMGVTRKPCNNASCPCWNDADVNNPSAPKTDYRFFYLKSGACMGFIPASETSGVFPGEKDLVYRSGSLMGITFDVNGEEEPNMRAKDQFFVPVDLYGIKYD